MLHVDGRDQHNVVPRIHQPDGLRLRTKPLYTRASTRHQATGPFNAIFSRGRGPAPEVGRVRRLRRRRRDGGRLRHGRHHCGSASAAAAATAEQKSRQVGSGDNGREAARPTRTGEPGANLLNTVAAVRLLLLLPLLTWLQ